ncbi:dihydrodipicolinate synthase family protein [Zobellia galactanivorans]|uniref:N-acetylneuraminate lyase n=1 Tax=Zobellia galactanivorans (strain DSM 12802 / CCUG 47099 / CIP 106680 / NCIMB 13871 / Dsij) TaxID=63186 RepID=G0L2N9_ZOBGA|nr:dihydrodipicolinate synthase family protein [Zobellia galactanivorans]MBU3027929.1 dihydrodipicolinate synthase family protein [Zobellia galactanivorans]CAZ95100.1 N-acetylneuraminate lyase [Zobellia galactanivorans]
MKPLKFDGIKGNWATLILPINSDERIDYPLLSQEIDFLIDAGVDGIYSNGSAGEFYNITEDEFDMVSEILADKCNKASLNFQIGASHMSPITSIERLRRSVDLKPSAIQVILPDWFVPTNEESIVFLKKMEEVGNGIGLVLYNPPHAKKKLTIQDIDVLKENVAGLIGVKLAGGDSDWYALSKRISSKLSVFIPGHHLATGIKAGCHGAYSNMSCLNPVAAQNWYDNMISGKLDEALELEGRIIEFLDKYIVPLMLTEGYSNMAMDKLLMQIGGWLEFNPKLRWPYKGVDSDTVARIRPNAKKMIPEFFNIS